MEFTKAPSWENKGIEPSSDQKTKGFSAGYKPPAAYFNWFWHLVGVCLDELQGASVELDEKISKAASSATYQVITLQQAKWAGKTYSFEDLYPISKYDIEIFPDSTCSQEQIEAWGMALITGSATSNVVTALGEVPTMDIPIIVKVVSKTLLDPLSNEHVLDTGYVDTGYYVEIDGDDENLQNVVNNESELVEGKYNFELL